MTAFQTCADIRRGELEHDPAQNFCRDGAQPARRRTLRAGGRDGKLAAMHTRDACNACRDPGDDRGHYESYFQRANHPERPLALWIRYTIFAPRGRRSAAVGELWAIFFDGEADRISAVKQVFPLAACRFSARGLDVEIGPARLSDGKLEGAASTREHALRWRLEYTSPEPPLLLLPAQLYAARLPRAKLLVGSPQAVFRGELEVDGRKVAIDGWTGSQNHNWGSRHTDRYAWGQVAGFDGEPEAFFECATARVKLGPVLTPPLTPMVLRYQGQEIRLSSLAQSWRAHGPYAPFRWQLVSRTRDLSIEATFEAPARAFVALRYDNPPGGVKVCLNSKLAACTLTLARRGAAPVVLRTRHRAAFEILGDERPEGVPLLEA